MDNNLENLENGIRETLVLPLVENMTLEAFTLLKQQMGVHYNFNRFEIATILGENYNKIILEKIPIEENINLNKIISIHNNNNNNNNYTVFSVPIELGFNKTFTSYIFRTLLNIDIDNQEEWLNYINMGGNYYWDIYICNINAQ